MTAPNGTITHEGRTCTHCGEFKPWERYSRHRTGTNGRTSECLECAGERKRLSEKIKFDPDCREAINLAVDRAPDRTPAIRLRQELEQHRAAGVPFSKAWRIATADVLDGMGGPNRKEWEAAFNETQIAWLAAYRPSMSNRTFKLATVVDDLAA